MTTPAGTGSEQNAAVPGEDTFTNFAKAIAQSPPTIREKLAIQLKKAGLYKGTVSSKFDNKFYNALLAAEQRRATLAPFVDVADRFAFINELAQEGVEVRPSKTIATSISDEATLRAMAMEVLKAKTGYEGSKEEINDLVKKVQRKQAKSPKVTTYKTEGGVTTSKTTGGVDEGQFLIDIVAQTDNSKANKVLNAYNIALNAFGGLR